jgi:hypothetical protein
VRREVVLHGDAIDLNTHIDRVDALAWVGHSVRLAVDRQALYLEQASLVLWVAYQVGDGHRVVAVVVVGVIKPILLRGQPCKTQSRKRKTTKRF